MLEEAEEKKKKQEKEKARAQLNDIPKDPEKEKRKFIDEMFGKEFPLYSPLLLDQTNQPDVIKLS